MESNLVEPLIQAQVQVQPLKKTAVQLGEKHYQQSLDSIVVVSWLSDLQQLRVLCYHPADTLEQRYQPLLLLLMVVLE